jgi:hypothetical protein
MTITQIMTSEQLTTLQNRMLDHFQLPQITLSSTGKRCRPVHNRKAIQAIEVADHFVQLSSLHPTDGKPVGLQAMTDEIRYNMGFTMIAWFFARIFISSIVKWLWQNYPRTI